MSTVTNSKAEKFYRNNSICSIQNVYLIISKGERGMRRIFRFEQFRRLIYRVELAMATDRKAVGVSNPWRELFDSIHDSIRGLRVVVGPVGPASTEDLW